MGIIRIGTEYKPLHPKTILNEQKPNDRQEDALVW